MPLMRRLVMTGVQRLLQDPRVQAKAAEVAQREVKPRVEAAARAGKQQLTEAAQDWRNAAEEVNPRDKPAEFAGRLKRRLLD